MSSSRLDDSVYLNTDVLIVGAGPTGLMLANQLARRGVRALIIDRHAGPALQTRALGVQARTLEIYAQLGIVERALELGKRATGANLWAEGRRTARVPLGDIGQGLSPYPFLLILGQDDNERLMGEALRRHGVNVRWNTELVALKQEADHVKATLKQPDGAIAEITAAWVAGCDGARSAVREMNAIDFRRRAVRARVLRRRYRSDRADGAGRAQCLSVARRIPSVLSDARQRITGASSASCRRSCATGTISTFEDVIPSVQQEAGANLIVQGVQLVLDLSHPSSACGALSRPPLFSAGRCGAHPQPGGRAGHEHRPAGCVQPGVEARAGCVGARGCRCSTPTKPSASPSRSGCCARPIARSS